MPLKLLLGLYLLFGAVRPAEYLISPCGDSTIAPGNTPLVDLKFSGMGCIPSPGVTFFETTKVRLAGGGYCSPVVTQQMNPLPLCNDCPVEEEYMVSGNIRLESGVGVYVVDDAPDQGVFIVSEEEAVGSGCPDPLDFILGSENDLTNSSNFDCWEATEAANCSGDYGVTFTCEKDAFVIMPKKNTNPLNGVTTFDLVLLQKHILGTAYLNSPYKIIAADANRSNTITASDLVELRKLILFILPEFSNNTSWRFVPANYTFPTPSNPFSSVFPECVHMDLSSGNVTSMKDFIAIKVGDVNLSAMNCTNFGSNEMENRGRSTELTAFSNTSLQAGETATVDFWIKDQQDLVSWELGLRFDTRFLQFEKAVPGDLEGMNVSCFGTTQAAGGKLRALWVSPYAQPVDFREGYQVFSLRFKTLRPVEDLASVLALDDAVLPGRAYENDGTANAFQLTFTEHSPVVSTKAQAPAELTVAAVPNPFSGELRFFISVTEDDWLELSVFDTNGRLVASWNGETAGREKEVLFSNTKSWGDGVFTYRVRTATQSAIGKISKQ